MRVRKQQESSKQASKGASHLATGADDHVKVRDVLAAVAGLGLLHLAHDVHAVEDLAEDDVLAVQEGRRHRGDEELAAVAVGAGVLRCR